MSISTHTDGRALRIAATGEIDMANCDELAAATRAAIKNGEVDSIVVDFAGITFMDSSGIRTLVMQQQQARTRGIDYRVVNLSPQVRAVLRITGLLERLTEAGSSDGLISAARQPDS